VSFAVRDKLTFAIPVAPEIGLHPKDAFTVNVSKDVIGAYGPGVLDYEKGVFHEYETEIRGGLVCSVVFDKKSAPLLLSTQVRATPLRPVRRPDMIYWPAGWEDAWFYGYVTPGGDNRDKFDLELTHANWSGRTYAYTYPDGVRMDFSVTNANPAYRLKTNARQLKLFDRITDFGIGLPTFIACESRNGVKAVPAGSGISGEDMAANWILAWFNGANGHEEFDVPFLFALEKRPDRVMNGGGALLLDFPEGAGTVQGMPLYGITLQAPNQTVGWCNGLPEDVVERCRFWSRVLMAAPVEVVRTAMIDYENDQVIIRDRFKHLNIKDDWDTSPIKLAFASPAMVLAEGADNIAMATGKPTRDLRYGTLHGPLLATENSDELRVRISKLLRFVREVRVVEQATTAQADGIRKDLNELVEGLWRKDHTFVEDAFIRYGIGASEPRFTNTLRALPLLKQPLRDEISGGLKAQARKYLFYRSKPEDEWRERLKHQDMPQLLSVSNPHTGLKLSFKPHYPCGTDVACWEALHVYVAWRYAHEFDDYEFIESNHETLKEIYNSARNTHDWQISATWDTFGGKRVGNGLQETNVIHGGAVCMARLAREFADQEMFNWASYHAVVQVVGMQAQLAASEFRRAYRPWSSGHSHAKRYEEQETWLPRYHAEQNAYAGFSYEDMTTKRSILGGSRAYCMTHVPELMRPYELWLDYGDDFFDHPNVYEFLSSRPINWTTFDPVFYLANAGPFPWDDFKEIRLKAARQDPRWDRSLPDYCGVLDYLGKIKYERLW